MSPPWTDAWLLVACELGGAATAAVPLTAIVAAADAVQHAAPTAEELDGGLARLATRGLLRREEAGFLLTEVARTLLGTLPPCVGWLTRQERLAERLGLAPWAASYLPAQAARGEEPALVSATEIAAALQRYRTK
jgi:hypothetical protein